MVIFYQCRLLFLFFFFGGVYGGALSAQDNVHNKQTFEGYNKKIRLFIQQVGTKLGATKYIQAAHTLHFFMQVYESYAPYVELCLPDEQKKFDQFVRYITQAYDQLNAALFMLERESDDSDSFIQSVDRVQAFFNANLLFLHTLGNNNANRIVIPIPISSSQSHGNSSITSLIALVVGTIGTFIFYFVLKDFFTAELKVKLKKLEERRKELKKKNKELKTELKSSCLPSIGKGKKDIRTNLANVLKELNRFEGEIGKVSNQVAELSKSYEKKVASIKGEVTKLATELVRKFQNKTANLIKHESRLKPIQDAWDQQRTVYEDLCKLRVLVRARLAEIESKKTASCSKELISRLKKWCNLKEWEDSEALFHHPA